MTREKAHRILSNGLVNAPSEHEWCMAFEMAIKALEQEPCNELPTVAIPQDNDGCENCRWQSKSESEMPCKQCMHNYTDKWEMEKPTDTITMTREEFDEKLMEHYRQGRADEKAYQNGEIMQCFSPD